MWGNGFRVAGTGALVKRWTADPHRRSRAMAKADKAAPVKGGGMKSLLLLVVISAVAVGAGAALPMLMGGGHRQEAPEAAGKHGGPAKPVFVPFGDVVVNIYNDNLSR